MAALGLCLKLTHLGVSQGSLHISDVPDGVDTLASFRKAGPIYVPYLGNVTVAYTGGVAISFEVGGIRGFIDRGLLAAEFVYGPTFVATLPGGVPSGPAGGDLDGTYPNPIVVDLTITGEVQGSILYFDGVNWIQLPPGTGSYVLATQGVGSNPIWIPVLHTLQFSGAGMLGVGNNVGMWWWNRTGRVLVVSDVTMWREVSGSSGSTIGDIEVDPTGTGAAFATIYAPANRPSIPSGTSPAFVQANTFASTSVPVGAVVRFNLAQVEGSIPQNIVAQVTMFG